LSERFELLQAWLAAVLGGVCPALAPASSDASFRRYWRLRHRGDTLIAVDAPPQSENNAAFVRLARALGSAGVHVPEILAEDLDRGFLLVGDLGDRLYLDQLRDDNADRLYGDAIRALINLQAAGPTAGLPDYDASFLRRELGLFDEWLLDGFLAIERDRAEQSILDAAYRVLIDSALSQPRVCVHRDFHSRNLMLTDRANPGVLDFQDAVLGPVTYDVVSLLKDCYIDWPPERVRRWAEGYFGLAVDAGLLSPEHEAAFPGWLDLMGAQRHLKAAGIFARLALRDGKPGYLQYLPRTLGYVSALAGRYPEIDDLCTFVETRVLPALTTRGASDLVVG
jgi:aminoglycoside/choline kinase family phosphotransferase